MPFAKLLSESTLLTSGGWLPLASVAKRTLVYGADRHGQLVERPVWRIVSAEKRRGAFLGSRTSFGYFSEATQLLDGTGTQRTIGDLIECMTVNDVLFENAIDLRSPKASEIATTALWAEMADGATLSSSKLILVRCWSVCKQEEAQLSEFHQFGTCRYCMIRRNLFEKAFRANWCDTIAALCLEWLTWEDGTIRIERKQHLLGLWIASALRKLGRNKRVHYDGLQHTSTLSFFDVIARPQPLEAGACAFFSANDFPSVVMQWDEPSWNPVSSGFFVGAD